MCQISLFRILLLLGIGSILYFTLLLLSSLFEERKLKKRRKQVNIVRERYRTILMVYIGTLIGIVSLGFILLKLYIRGVL